MINKLTRLGLNSFIYLKVTPKGQLVTTKSSDYGEFVSSLICEDSVIETRNFKGIFNCQGYSLARDH